MGQDGFHECGARQSHACWARRSLYLTPHAHGHTISFYSMYGLQGITILYVNFNLNLTTVIVRYVTLILFVYIHFSFQAMVRSYMRNARDRE